MASFNQIVNIDGQEVPFKVHIERRNSVRVSFGRSCINLRIPSSLSGGARERHFADAVKWVKGHSQKNPNALNKYKVKDYDEIPNIAIYGESLPIIITYKNRQSGSGKYNLKKKSIDLSLPNAITGIEKDKMVKSLLSRVCGQLFLPKVTARVMEINDKCFHKEIKSVNLKYNKSNWGSCSTASNVNLSTRLLFAPFDVIDYVIVHELAHLYEMNHSTKFWNIVRQIMPDYKEKEKWLRLNGALCDF
ncbi:MAG: putative metal-dependent hydrolase [Saprospiraceae bacterium]|jgi:predicted metal-dependent hydrolase|tara:strand:- start:588 stop:1328 length:741 start_codon:yes stop_codon:yes gene_type:complete